MSIGVTDISKPTIALLELRASSQHISFTDTEMIVSITPTQLTIREI